MKKPIDDSWIWKPGIDRLEDVYETSPSDPPGEEEPDVWAEVAAMSWTDPHYYEKVLRVVAKDLPWIEAYAARLPKVIRKQDVRRALNDPRWLDEDSIQRRAENRERVARQRAKARATDLDAFRKSEREGRARRRKAKRYRKAGGVSPILSVQKPAQARP